MYPNRKNMHILFHELVLCESGSKMVKILLDDGEYNKLLLYYGDTSLLFKGQKQKRCLHHSKNGDKRWILGLSYVLWIYPLFKEDSK